MKKFKLLSLVGITSIVLTQAGWAGGHGGGGFGGGHSGGSRGGGDSVGGARMSSGVPHFNGEGAGPSSSGMRPSDRQPVESPPASRLVTPSVRAATPSGQGVLSARDHVFGRRDGNWHQDWDRRHAHFRNGHPWDYYPYSAYDYDPYDYSPGYSSDVESAYSNDGSADQQANPTVSAVQSRLAELGYYHGVVDGLFGPDTRAALTRYQIDNRLSVTASLTTETLQSLGLQKIATS